MRSANLLKLPPSWGRDEFALYDLATGAEVGRFKLRVGRATAEKRE
jgi:hypothetical protein